ncbi:MAG: Sterol-binding domain protein [Gammaproteobacteria bacterium]|jgi:ubiquinone biosynthesis protein UbiJ|nr:Sterol-binding domain protein [Gammaproteobacteria bacterium]
MKIIRNALAALIEKTLNSYLNLDPELSDLIGPLQAKTLKVTVEDWNLNIFLAPHAKGFRIYLKTNMDASVGVSGRLTDLMEFALSRHPQALISSGKIKQSGDIHILQSYQSFIEKSQIDWEGLLAKVIGEAAAFELCKKARQAKAWQKDSLRSSCQDLSEYLQEESRLLPPREEVEDFFEDIAKLREDVERLEAKINLFHSK